MPPARLLAVLLLVVAGCAPAPIALTDQSLAESTTLTATAEPFDGIETLLNELDRLGVEARGLSVGFDDTFAGSSVSLLCVSGQKVSLFVFASEEHAQRAASSIDPQDPSRVGASMYVSWVGNPTFWQRGRLIVLYPGPDAQVEATLTTMLGQPFARGLGRGLVQANGPDC